MEPPQAGSADGTTEGSGQTPVLVVRQESDQAERRVDELGAKTQSPAWLGGKPASVGNVVPFETYHERPLNLSSVHGLDKGQPVSADANPWWPLQSCSFRPGRNGRRRLPDRDRGPAARLGAGD